MSESEQGQQAYPGSVQPGYPAGRIAVIERTGRSINVLFTSAGRRVELLKAFRRAYKSLGLAGQIVAIDTDWLSPALQVADRRYIVPRLESPDYIPSLVEICRREAIHLVFPLIDPDIPKLAQHREQIEETGARVAVVPMEAAAITGDKWLTARFFQRLDLPTARSWLPEQVDPETIEYPLFIKPRRGSAAKGTYIVRSPRELDFFASYVPEPIVQEYLPGPEITTDVICDLGGDVLGVVSRQRIEVRWGEVAKAVTVYDPVITETCLKIARSLPAIGPINIQCMMKGGTPFVTEINARFGGGTPLGIAAGVDSPCWLLARTAGLELPLPPLGTYTRGLYMTRFDDSFFLPEDERELRAVQQP